MPAPKDQIRKEIWKINLSKAHKGISTWNKGIKMPNDFRLKMGELSLKFWKDPANAEKIKIRNIEFLEQYPLERITVVDFYLSKFKIVFIVMALFGIQVNGLYKIK